MSDTMPEHLWVERISYVDEVRYDGWEESKDGDTEYIRADVHQAQLDAANKRTERLSIELEQTRKAEVDARYYDSYQMNEIESIQAIIKERDATIIAFQTRVTELRHDLNMVIDQRNAANARIAELEGNLNDCRFVITELKARLAEEGRDAINQKLIEKDYELRTTRSELLERISMLLAEREWMPVGEGLPKMYTAVYVTVRTPQGKNDIDFAFMTQAGWSYHLSQRNGTVTHWMPLPPPPVTP